MDLRKLKTLLSLMEEHRLMEMELEEEGMKVRFSKREAAVGGGTSIPAAPAVSVSEPKAASLPAAAPPPSGAGACKVTAPMVGTFYRAPRPGAEPFVDVGKAVGKETIVCVIEAMKVMNEVRAGVEGVVERILVENGEAVEYGQEILHIRSSLNSE
jgi:acetyl-CoA carboxylase biotin carboxyl carrier protein